MYSQIWTTLLNLTIIKVKSKCSAYKKYPYFIKKIKEVAPKWPQIFTKEGYPAYSSICLSAWTVGTIPLLLLFLSIFYLKGDRSNSSSRDRTGWRSVPNIHSRIINTWHKWHVILAHNVSNYYQSLSIHLKWSVLQTSYI